MPNEFDFERVKPQGATELSERYAAQINPVIECTLSDTEPTREQTGSGCNSATEALVVDGPGIGQVKRIGVAEHCPVHGSRVQGRGNDEDFREQQRQRERQFQKEREKAERTKSERLQLLERIAQAAPFPIPTAEFRVLLRALINCDPYRLVDAVSDLYEALDSNDATPDAGQSVEDVLTSRVDAADERGLTTLFVRLALADHVSAPQERTRDFLNETAAAFGVALPQKKSAKKNSAEKKATKSAKHGRANRTVKKTTAKKPTGKAAKKKGAR
ncbi:MAG: hypothetical protein ACR2JB_12980 [Bryobacteraceae bacterium]